MRLTVYPVQLRQGVQHWTMHGPKNVQTEGHGYVLKSLSVKKEETPMKTEELTAIGLTEEQATQVLAMNGKDIEKHKKQITVLEGERDAAKAQLDTANETLKKFEGIDPQQIQTELQTYKTKAEEAEKKFTREMTQRDQRDWIGKKLDEYGVTSPYARRQLTSDIMAEDSGLSWKDGAYYGL